MNMPQPDSGMNKCSTLIGGVGILLGMASIAFFGKGSIHIYSLIYIVILIALNFLSYHAEVLRVIIAILAGSSAVVLVVFSFPDFISSNMKQSKLGAYYMFVGLLSASVCLCQIRAMSIKNSNK
jgi:hypothetical protein